MASLNVPFRASAIALLGFCSAAVAQETYEYDPHGRLVGVYYAAADQSICYGYDELGNRAVEKSIDGVCASNNAPLVGPDGTFSFRRNIGGVFDPLANDSDPDGDSLFIANVSAPSGLEVSVTSDQKLEFDRSTYGQYVMTYTVTDYLGGAVEVTQNINVNF